MGSLVEGCERLRLLLCLLWDKITKNKVRSFKPADFCSCFADEIRDREGHTAQVPKMQNLYVKIAEAEDFIAFAVALQVVFCV